MIYITKNITTTMQARISATISPEAKRFLVSIAKQLQVSQSEALEKAIDLLERQVTLQQMRKGYLNDQTESLDFAENAILLTDFLDAES
ncbi:MAG TPA: hypothetical protein VIT68_02130 [Candidatus Gracilibacteria bacterium]